METIEYLLSKDSEYRFTPCVPQYQYICADKPKYEIYLPLKVSVAEIFKLMGFDVQVDYTIAGISLDIFAKKRDHFLSQYYYWVCRCISGKKINKRILCQYSTIINNVKKQLEYPQYSCSNCRFMIISDCGHLKGIPKDAYDKSITIKTYNQLLSDLKTFYSAQKPLIEELECVFAFPD